MTAHLNTGWYADGQLDHPRRESFRAVELTPPTKAELAHSAAMVRSAVERERFLYKKKEVIERQAGEAGEHRRGAEVKVRAARRERCFASGFSEMYQIELKKLGLVVQ